MKTAIKTKAISAKDVKESWFMIDANGRRLGNIASIAAQLLLGKSEPTNRAYLTPKAKVVIINAAGIDFTQKRGISKLYTNYSGFPGGLKTFTMAEMMEKDPERVVRRAIHGMMPKNKRSDKILAENLYVYNGAEHEQEAQVAQMQNINLKEFKI